MTDQRRGARTSALWEMLFDAPDADGFLRAHAGEIGLVPFCEYILDLCARRGEAPERVIRRADIEKSYGHSLFRGARNPSREMVLRLAFGFEADLPLAQSLLWHAGRSPLYPRVPRDVVIGYCLMKKLRLMDAQHMLADREYPPIGGDIK